MKKLVIFGLIGLMGVMGAKAQLDLGARAGVGIATISDDLSTKSPIFGAGVGGYLNINFTNSESVAGQFVYLQTGLSLNRRGSNFHEVLENENTMSVREGYYHAYYLQLPILVGFHMELPIRSSGHVVGIIAGPAVSFGLFGRCQDRLISPGNPSPLANYDYSIVSIPADASREEQQAIEQAARQKREVFNHLKRLDVSAIVGLTYEFGPWNAILYLDHGFMATSTEPDILRIITQSMMGGDQGLKTEIPNGYNTAVMFSIGYSFINSKDR